LRKASVSFVGIAYYVSKRNAAKPKIASPHANKISSFTKISRLTSGSNSRAFVLTYHYTLGGNIHGKRFLILSV
jgi:hypothetical protein